MQTLNYTGFTQYDPFQSYLNTLLHPISQTSTVIFISALIFLFNHLFQPFQNTIWTCFTLKPQAGFFFSIVVIESWIFLFYLTDDGKSPIFKLPFCVILAFSIISLPDGRKWSSTRYDISVEAFWSERTQFWPKTVIRGKKPETTELKKHFAWLEFFKSLYLYFLWL